MFQIWTILFFSSTYLLLILSCCRISHVCSDGVRSSGPYVYLVSTLSQAREHVCQSLSNLIRVKYSGNQYHRVGRPSSKERREKKPRQRRRERGVRKERKKPAVNSSLFFILFARMTSFFDFEIKIKSLQENETAKLTTNPSWPLAIVHYH